MAATDCQDILDNLVRQLPGVKSSLTNVVADSLPIPRPPRPRCAGFLLACKSTMFGIRVPPLPFVVPDHRRKIEPDDNILGAMLLGFSLVLKRLQTERRHRQRETDDQARNEFR